MAFLRQSRNDVFVSYCHDDDRHAEGERGWVRRFYEKLRLLLSQHSGQGDRMEIWIDERLGGAEVFDRSIPEAIRSSGVLLALISPSYRTSDYCKQEIEWFSQAVGVAGLEVDNFRRVFPVLLHETEFRDWPEVCRGTSGGYRFYHQEGEDRGWPLDPGTGEFRQELRRLVEDLWRVLCKLQEQATAEAAEPTAEASFRVFLSHPPADLAPDRRRIAAELERKGIEVLDPVPPPADQAGHAAAAARALAEADLAVHLLGLGPGRPVEGAEAGVTYPAEQVRIGLEHARAQLLLTREEFALEFVENPRHRAFLESLESREGLEELTAERFEIVRASGARMVDEILAKRRRLLDAARREAASAAPMTAFVDFDGEDLEQAHGLVSYLEEKGVGWLMGRSADASMFEQNLRKARLLLVVFGTPRAREWVRNRLIEAQKLVSALRLPTLIGVYAAPPRKPREELNFGLEVADGMDRFNSGALDSLLQRAAAR